MKTLISTLVALASSFLFAFGPGGSNPPGGIGGGGTQPGGGGNQPDQPGGGGEGGGGGGQFTYDTFLTDSSVSGGCICYGELMTGYVEGETTITLPQTVTAVADGALAGCESVTTLNVTSATGLRNLPNSFATGCELLSQVNLPTAVTNVGSSAFEGCSKLATLKAKALKTVGTAAFRNCAELIEIPTALTAIGEYGFAYCGVTNLYVNKATLGECAFAYCQDLKTASVPASYPESAFAGCNFTITTDDPPVETQTVEFESAAIEATEGNSLVIRVAGGSETQAASVKVCLAYQSATAADLNLAKASVDGVVQKLTFPLTLTWEAGDISTHEISIPVKTDGGKEVDEMLTFQLASVTGCQLGTPSNCTAILHDAKGSTTSDLPFAYGLPEPADGGRVVGAVRRAAGKAVVLRAVANKGYVFIGWYANNERLTEAASYRFTMPEEGVCYTARFATKDEDAAALTCALDGFALSCEENASASNTCGIRVSYPIDATGLTQVKVTASGLPTGLRLIYNKTTGAYSVSGIPTVASRVNAKTGLVTPSTSRFYVTSTGKSRKIFIVNWLIGALPTVAVGKWNGIAATVDGDGDTDPIGSFTFTTTATGTLVAKAVTTKGTASYSARGWIEEESGLLTVAMTNKTYGILTLQLDPKADWTTDTVIGSISGGKFGTEEVQLSAYRYPFAKTSKVVENPEAQEVLANSIGSWPIGVVGPEGEALTGTARILKTGRVTVTGKLANGKTSYALAGLLEVRSEEGLLIPVIRLIKVTKAGCIWCNTGITE